MNLILRVWACFLTSIGIIQLPSVRRRNQLTRIASGATKPQPVALRFTWERTRFAHVYITYAVPSVVLPVSIWARWTDRVRTHTDTHVHTRTHARTCIYMKQTSRLFLSHALHGLSYLSPSFSLVPRLQGWISQRTFNLSVSDRREYATRAWSECVLFYDNYMLPRKIFTQEHSFVYASA